VEGASLRLASNDGGDYDASMARTAQRNLTRLTIRNVDVRLKEKLRLRAAQHGHSMEAELREILRRAVTVEEPDETNSGRGDQETHGAVRRRRTRTPPTGAVTRTAKLRTVIIPDINAVSELVGSELH
jgi:antitoxin FitA